MKGQGEWISRVGREGRRDKQGGGQGEGISRGGREGRRDKQGREGREKG